MLDKLITAVKSLRTLQTEACIINLVIALKGRLKFGSKILHMNGYNTPAYYSLKINNDCKKFYILMAYTIKKIYGSNFCHIVIS